MNLLRRVLREVPLARALAIRARMLRHPEGSTPGRQHGVLFLVYHGMDASDRPAFARQLVLLQRHGRFASLADSLLHLGRPPSGERRICLTFDDGRQDAARHALPMLAEAGIPATLFIVSDWIDRRRPGTLTWPDLARLAASGVTIGSHGATHRRLATLDPPAATEELQRSRARIEAMTGQPCQDFAAPFGQPDADFLPDRDPHLARLAGYRSFLTTIARGAIPNEDPRLLPRIRMEPGWSKTELAYALWR